MLSELRIQKVIKERVYDSRGLRLFRLDTILCLPDITIMRCRDRATLQESGERGILRFGRIFYRL